MESNPKTHDSLFKWLIASFTLEFFAHYFPDVPVGKYRFIDKEFIKKYEALKESLKNDLFLAVELEIDGQLWDAVIMIEHQSERKNVAERVFEYLCYAWLLEKKPVWSIVIYSDDAVWRKPVPDAFWYGFSQSHKKHFHHFDVIKVKAEKSGDLIKKHSLLCKLLALKADDREQNPENLVREIYRAMSGLREQLTNDQLLLIERWMRTYKKIEDKQLVEIKKEVDMEMVETTISEHIFNEGVVVGRVEGEEKGVIKGKVEGKIEGKIELLENMYILGMITKEQLEHMVTPLRSELKALEKKMNDSDALFKAGKDDNGK